MGRHLRGCMRERQTFFALAPICLDIRSYSQYSPGLSDDSSETAMLLFFAAALLVRASHPARGSLPPLAKATR